MNAVLADTSYKQPIFSLEFNIYGTGAEIRLNDIPVYYHDTEGQTSSQKPVPESIVNGENSLTVRSFPLEENGNKYQQGAYIEAIISIREKSAPLNENKTILHLKLNPTNAENKLLENTLAEYGDKKAMILDHNKKQTTAERRTNIKSPFPGWAWQDGQIIENTKENFISLIEVYREIWNALNDNDINELRALYDPAAQEFSIAYHYKDKKHGHRIMNTDGLMKDDEWDLADINKLLARMAFHLNIYANGKLANIIDDKHRKSPILYIQKKSQNISFNKFDFYKNKAGKWIMIR